MIADKLKLEGQILGEDMAMYVHHELMVQLEILAQKYDLPLVDNIRLVDIEPEGLVTQVHLSEGANTRLAEELYKVIHPIILTH